MVLIEQDSTGDAMLKFRLTSTSNSCIGIDNSDSDYFKIAPQSDSFAAASTYIRGNTENFTVVLNTAGSFDVYRDDTSVVAALQVEQDGTGDAAMRFLLTGGTEWHIGCDNSDSDKFKIGPWASLGVDNIGWQMATDGRTGHGIATSPSIWNYCAPPAQTAQTVYRTKFVAVPGGAVANSANFFIGMHLGVTTGSTGPFGIATGITDSGNREAFRVECFAPDISFDGTLNKCIGAFIRVGSATAGPNSVITNTVGVLIQHLTAANTTMTNKWGIYQSAQSAQNYFAGNMAIGSPSKKDSLVHTYLNDIGVIPSVKIEQDSTGDPTLNFLLTSTQGYVIGIDNSDSDLLKIANGNTCLTGYAIAVGATNTVTTGASVHYQIDEVNVNTTLTDQHHTLLVNTNSADRVVTLPAASGATMRLYTVKKIDAAANTVTIDGNGAETIDGAANTVLSSQYDGITLQSDGTTWWVISRT
jgi:hypothetical protein